MKRFPLIAAVITAASLGAYALAGASDGIPNPPKLVANDRYMTNTVTVTLDGSMADVRTFMAANPLTDFLEPAGRIPRIAGVVVLDGEWGEPDSLRRIDLEGGFHTHERVLTNDNDEFTYQIWDITTSAGRFINHIYGEIRFVENAGQTTITWNYNVKPAVFFARGSIRTFLNEDFAPFMENGMNGFVTAFAEQGV